MDPEEVMETERVRSSLTQFRQVGGGISAVVEAAPNAMGNFIAEERQDLERRVRGLTVQWLKSLRKRFRDSVE